VGAGLYFQRIARDTTSSGIPTGDAAVWTIEHRVRLKNDETPEEVVDFTVTDHMDEWSGLDRWEQKVRDVGFRAMRKTVAGGLHLREHALLRTWTHLG
jgi:hypothetical protein